MGMEKKKHRLKVLETNLTYIRFYQDSPEEHDSSSTTFLSTSDGRVYFHLLEC